MVIAPMLVAFTERYPEIAIDLALTNRFIDLVQEGTDLAVRAGRLVKGDLIARKLCDSELQLAASPKTAAQLKYADDLRSLQQQPFILYRAAGGKQTLKLERGAGKRSTSLELEVSGRITVDDYAALAELVAVGGAIGLMPRIHVRDGAEAGRLVRVFPEWSSRSAQIHLVYPTRQQPERSRLLTAFLIDAFSRVGHV
jgi:DNA-binding transcriptional LysR family regulator